MARLPGSRGQNPFSRSPRSPGPLGYNDAASPESPHWLVGDTPGPLGMNDWGHPLGARRNTASHVLPANVNVSVTSENKRVSEALVILSKIPTFVSILKEVGGKSPKSVHVLVELAKPDTTDELGQTSDELSEDDISNDGTTIDYYRVYRESGIPDSVIPWGASEWERVFQGKHVNQGARVFLVRVTEQSTVYDIASTIGHEIGAHVRGSVLGISRSNELQHIEWGSKWSGFTTDGTLAWKFLNELNEYKKKH